MYKRKKETKGKKIKITRRVKSSETEAQLVADYIVEQLKRRFHIEEW